MKITFADKQLESIKGDEAHKLGLPFAVIKACRHKLTLIEAAPDERTLRNWKSLNYKKLQGDQEGLRQIRINDQYRIVFRLDESTQPPTIEITEIGDTHR